MSLELTLNQSKMVWSGKREHVNDIVFHKI